MPLISPEFDEAMAIIRRVCDQAATEQEALHYSRQLDQQRRFLMQKFRKGNALSNMLRENPLSKSASRA